MNVTIEKNIPFWSHKTSSKYNFLLEMEVGDSIHLESKRDIMKVLATITNWKNKNKGLRFYETMEHRKYSYRTLKDNSYRLWRVK